MPKYMIPLVALTMLVWCAPPLVQGCSRQETTNSTTAFRPSGVTLSAHRYVQRYAPGIPFDVTCSDLDIASYRSLHPCTVVIQNPRRVIGIVCQSSDVGDTADACYLSGSF